MNLFLLDGIGPFFRALDHSRINWSKIPFAHLPLSGAEGEWFWRRLETDFRTVAARAKELGYNAITLDDLAHLTPHPWHSEEMNERLEFFAEKFSRLFAILEKHDLQAWVTADVISLSPEAAIRVGKDFDARTSFFYDLFNRFCQRHPSVKGLILRIGESDGLDVRDELRSNLHIRSAKEVNKFLRGLLTHAEEQQKDIILRTWTVGAHRIGDLIWHRGRLSEALNGIESERFILSMKPAESDFFRHLPINKAFFRYQGPKILELQARREYEGAGEFPSWIGPECEDLRDELIHAENMRGISVWCQTGGWHRFKRLTFLDKDALWAEVNTRSAIDIFRHGLSANQSVAKQVGPERAAAATELLEHTRHIILNLYYIPEFARLKLFFRRVRIPPLLHIYWDSLYIHAPIRKILRHFVSDQEAALHESEGALHRFPRVIELAQEAGWPEEDLRFMRDTCALIHLARTYYFSTYNKELVKEIKAAKRAYKEAWPSEGRARYRIKTDFAPSALKGRTLVLMSKLLLRRQRGYRRVMDHFFTLNLLSFLYRLFRNRSQEALPKTMRDSAMGLDSVFK
ncbi:hypothetical protein [Roseibacillus ishigakijimensis]|uniref:Uncharacterized protein n=1 Tax=Roseibacillus ishigakijimensis TaxID=454146 RepID=A0A934VIK1_9BACT|nr:hypothetical protein [Roseibacillus ishigakijimensis]MBK1835158.1 hypothetical protein [Roseibacillus ishigakijimensis]